MPGEGGQKSRRVGAESFTSTQRSVKPNLVGSPSKRSRFVPHIDDRVCFGATRGEFRDTEAFEGDVKQLENINKDKGSLW